MVFNPGTNVLLFKLCVKMLHLARFMHPLQLSCQWRGVVL